MFTQTAVPELLELTLQYLTRPDLHSCSLVNRQFNVCARPLLYRDISFYLHPEQYNHQDMSQDQLFTRLQSQDIINHVHHISIYFNKIHFGYKYSASAPSRIGPDFTTKVANILSRVTSLKTVHIENVIRSMYDHSVYQRGGDAGWEHLDIATRAAVTNVLESVLTSPNSPDVSLKLYHYHNKGRRLYDMEGINDIEGNSVALQLNQQQRVSCLAIMDVGIPEKLDFILQFRQLTELEVFTDKDVNDYNGSPVFGTATDLANLFEHMPLTKLTLPCAIPGIEFTSLPRGLQYLHLDNIYFNQWRVVSDLEMLQTLKINREDLRFKEDQPLRFRSTGLKIFQGEYRQDSIVTRSIFTVCGLESLDVTLDDKELIPLLHHLRDVGSSIKSLHIHTLPGHYHIHRLIELLNNTPRLEKFTIPWPTITSTAQPRYYRRLQEETPMRLSLLDFQTIAKHCQHLETIEFDIYPTVHDNFIHFRNESTRGQTLFDATFEGRQNRSFAIQQLYKKDVFFAKSSPCLDICTTIYHYAKGRFSGSQKEFNKLVLTMSQVRKHSNQSYNLL